MTSGGPEYNSESPLSDFEKLKIGYISKNGIVFRLIVDLKNQSPIILCVDGNELPLSLHKANL